MWEPVWELWVPTAKAWTLGRVLASVSLKRSDRDQERFWWDVTHAAEPSSAWLQVNTCCNFCNWTAGEYWSGETFLAINHICMSCISIQFIYVCVYGLCKCIKNQNMYISTYYFTCFFLIFLLFFFSSWKFLEWARFYSETMQTACVSSWDVPCPEASHQGNV